MSSTNKILFFVGNLVFFLIVLFLVYTYGYAKYKNILDERNTVFDRFHSINIQLDDFGAIQMSMDEQKKEILEIISQYKDTFYSNSQNVSSYKMKIIGLLRNANIACNNDDVVQKAKGKDTVLEIKVTATYEQICKFLFEVERFSYISKIEMDYKGSTYIECSPILFSAVVNDNFSDRSSVISKDDVTKAGYFKEIYDKIQGVKDVGYITSWRDFEPIPNSPFYFYVQKKKVFKKGKGGVFIGDGSKPEIVLDGIMYEKTNPIVIIEGKFFYVGDKYKNAKIVAINQNNIKVENYGRVYTIKMEN